MPEEEKVDRFSEIEPSIRVFLAERADLLTPYYPNNEDIIGRSIIKAIVLKEGVDDLPEERRDFATKHADAHLSRIGAFFNPERDGLEISEIGNAVIEAFENLRNGVNKHLEATGLSDVRLPDYKTVVLASQLGSGGADRHP